MAKNILGGDLIPCSTDPLTGFFRNGKCDTRADDAGMHTICVLLTNEFLAFSKAHGNDLSTPIPEYGFPGLEEGDYWCHPVFCRPLFFSPGGAPGHHFQGVAGGGLVCLGPGGIAGHWLVSAGCRRTVLRAVYPPEQCERTSRAE